MTIICFYLVECNDLKQIYEIKIKILEEKHANLCKTGQNSPLYHVYLTYEKMTRVIANWLQICNEKLNRSIKL